ncbi:MAG: type II secretion system F family protein [Candidatus Aenigmarchaeota archaeon]|nr:type II secretion system F family protein [Candidatus Aenigmarchaeota archaeon]
MIPFVPLPLDKAVKVSRPFIGLSNKLHVLFPYLDTKLSQANIPVKGKEYLSVIIFSTFFWFALTAGLLLTLGLFLKNLPPNFTAIALLGSSAISFIAFFYINFYPNAIVIQKTKDIDKNLLFALRHLLIQVKSGVPLFESLVSVAKGNYGLISVEFTKSTKNIATGMSQSVALEEIAYKNPSLYFRRTIWQLVNSLKAGADIGNTLEVLVQSLSNEQRVAIRKYGSQLGPLALMYMMVAVIMPALGITFLIIFSSISSLQVSEIVFYMILGFLVIFQLAYSGLIKNNRPSVEL